MLQLNNVTELKLPVRLNERITTWWLCINFIYNNNNKLSE